MIGSRSFSKKSMKKSFWSSHGTIIRKMFLWHSLSAKILVQSSNADLRWLKTWSKRWVVSRWPSKMTANYIRHQTKMSTRISSKRWNSRIGIVCESRKTGFLSLRKKSARMPDNNVQSSPRRSEQRGLYHALLPTERRQWNQESRSSSQR